MVCQVCESDCLNAGDITIVKCSHCGAEYTLCEDCETMPEIWCAICNKQIK